MTTNIDPKPITIGTWNVRYAPEVFGDIDKEYDSIVKKDLKRIPGTLRFRVLY